MGKGKRIFTLVFSVALAALLTLAHTARAANSAGAPAPSVTCVPTGTPAPAPTPTLETIPLPPDGPADSFFTDSEVVTSDDAHGHWRYTSPTLWVDIRKVRLSSRDITFFVADIRTRGDYPFRSGAAKGLALPEVIAKKVSAVYAQNGDFDTMERNLKGIIIRDGKILSNRKGADTMAILPDGTLKIYSPGETTPQELLAMGVHDTWSFGPTLIRGGMMRTNYNSCRNHGKNPRSAFGMIEPGHYIGIAVGGRNPGYSVGMTYLELAQLFQLYGCREAYSFDGGASTSMVFMGKPMDLRIKKMGGNQTTKRRVPEIFVAGSSSLVPGQ